MPTYLVQKYAKHDDIVFLCHWSWIAPFAAVVFGITSKFNDMLIFDTQAAKIGQVNVPGHFLYRINRLDGNSKLKRLKIRIKNGSAANTLAKIENPVKYRLKILIIHIEDPDLGVKHTGPNRHCGEINVGQVVLSD